MKQIQRIFFLVLVFIIANISTVQANLVTYNVEGVFFEPNTQPNNTVFSGTFDWDGSTLSNLTGMMNSSMMVSESTPNLSLANNLITSQSGSIVTASIFLINDSAVFMTGGYDAAEHAFPSFPSQGMAPSPNTNNAYFTFSFDTAGGMVAPTGLTSSMQYGDCTSDGMMSSSCMTGFGPSTGVNGIGNPIGEGTMGGFASSLVISEVSAVPVPAAVWLFGTALVGMIGVSRKRNLQA